VTIGFMTALLKCTQSAIDKGVRNLLSGDLVAFPTETVYGLGADALNLEAVTKIFQVKARPLNHPLIVHISTISTIQYWARKMPDYALTIAEKFWPGPLTLLLPKTTLAKDFITGGQDCVGIRIPRQKQALSLLSKFEQENGLGVAAPSANRFGKLSPTSAQDVAEDLGEFLSEKDLILDGGICQVGLESTILDCRLEIPIILRPGAISGSEIKQITGVEPKLMNDDGIRVSGLLKSHYAPKAKIYLTGEPKKGDGFIALSNFETPSGAIRLSAPRDVVQFAHLLYRSLRLADQKKIKKVYVIPPVGDTLGAAIRDRLIRASTG